MSTRPRTIGIVLGTRPEIIKMSPVIRACRRRRQRFFILHTNQHYSPNLDRIFFSDLGLPRPDYNLGAGSGTHAEETGRMLIGIEKVLKKEKPSVVLVEGDTNTVLAGALAAAKLHISVGHVEAGLRSYFREMPEEINRIMTDHCSDFLFAPTPAARGILLGEGISRSRIFMTGNTIVDAVRQAAVIARRRSTILRRLSLVTNGYLLVTAHRMENVDSKQRLRGMIEGVARVAARTGLPAVYPAHPRARKMLAQFRVAVPPSIRVIDPVGFFDFLMLESQARLILTDSGGVQEESCILRKPCVTMRDNTERPETVTAGGNTLAGTDPAAICAAAVRMMKKPRRWRNPLGNGRTGEHIIDILLRCL